MASVHIKNIILGEGVPKICVPLTDRSLAELERSLNNMRGRHFDLVEWRADKFEAFRQHFTENADVGNTLKEAASLIRSAFPDKPIIYTIRTNRDMEDFEISDEAYAKAISYAVGEGLCDIIDIEQSRGAALVIRLVNLAHEYGIKTIVSKHLAKHTPAEDEIVSILQDMQVAGADIVKLAVMPQAKADVMSLLNATYRYAAEPDSVPVITMSMGRLGVISRLSGSLTGSCLTFGTVGAASAPGQIDCEELARILDILA